MANTYTQIYVQIIFAVQGRENLIHENLRDELEKYMCGIITNNKSKVLEIYCNPDHTHVLIGLHPTVSVATMAGDIKASSSKWLNEKKVILGKFSWQDCVFWIIRTLIPETSGHFLGLRFLQK